MMKKRTSNMRMLLLGEIEKEYDHIASPFLPGEILRINIFESNDDGLILDKKKGKPDILGIPITHRYDLHEFFLLNCSLPYGLTVDNSPVTLTHPMTDNQFQADERTIVIINAQDWVSIALLPFVIENLLDTGTDIEIHLASISQLSSDTPPQDRYRMSAKKYGGLRELALMAATLNQKFPLQWYVWDIGPLSEEYQTPLNSIVKFLYWRCRYEYLNRPLNPPGRLKQHQSDLFPAICRAGGVGEIGWDHEKKVNRIHECAISHLNGIINRKSDLPTRSGWSEIEWIRRPTFYTHREDLEKYLTNYVWVEGGWNATWEQHLNEIVTTADNRLIKYLPEITDFIDSDHSDGIENLQKYNAWFKSNMELALNIKENMLSESSGLYSFALTWFQSSDIAKLGYAWTPIETLLGFLSNKRTEILERLRLCKKNKNNLSDELNRYIDELDKFSSLPAAITKKKNVKIETVHKYTAKARSKLELHKSNIVEAINEISWLNALEAALEITQKLLKKIPEFRECSEKLTLARGKTSSINDEIFAVLALYHMSNKFEWFEFWDDIWSEVLTSDVDPGPEGIIQNGLSTICAPSDEAVEQWDTIAQAFIKEGMTLEDAKQTIIDNQTNVKKGKKPDSTIKDTINVVKIDKAKKIALSLNTKGEVLVRLRNKVPRQIKQVIGQLTDPEEELLNIYSDASFDDVADMGGTKAAIISVSELFSFDRIKTFIDGARDWRIWFKENHRAGLKNDCVHLLWTPGAKNQNDEYKSVRRHTFMILQKLINLWLNKKIDWDAEGRITKCKLKEKNLHEWMEGHWRRIGNGDSVRNDEIQKIADETGQVFTEENLTAIGRKRLMAIPGISGSPPFLCNCLETLIGDPISGLIKMQAEYLTPSRQSNLWTFNLQK